MMVEICMSLFTFYLHTLVLLDWFHIIFQIREE